MWETTVGKLARLLGATVHGDDGASVRRVAIDSRRIDQAATVFFGLRGPRFDGGRFAAEALANRATCVVVERAEHVPSEVGEQQAVLVVADVTAALQQLAAEARRRFRGRVLAITGSNGKTIVKEMLRAALGESLKITASPMSWNSQIGVALSLLNLDADADLALIECGISREGEMQRLREMVRPDAGILVNIGLAHRETLLSAETTAREKATLFAELPRETGWVLVPREESLAIAALRAQGTPETQIRHPSLDSLGVSRVSPRARYQTGERIYELDATAGVLEADVELALSAAVSLGVEPDEALAGLEGWRPASMRLERLTTPEGVHVINDAYSADLESVSLALTALENEQGDGRRIAVFGSLAQLGKARRPTHHAIGRGVAASGVDLLLVVGTDAQEIADAAADAGLSSSAIHVFEEREDAAAYLREVARPGDRVLVKGSRPARLEQIVDRLLTPLAPARVYVDLDQVARNLDRLRTIVGPAVRVMPVVKSFGYGLDSRKLAETYERSGADMLCVAYPDEGVMLRRHGVRLPIMVQNVLAHELSKLVEHDLDAQLADADLARRLGAYAAAYGTTVRVHLKVDTGMGRAGVLPDAAYRLAHALSDTDGIELIGLMTHLAAADEQRHDAFTEGQIESFAGLRDRLSADGIRFRYVHAANSAGAVRFRSSRFSMVRSGIGLLGYLELDAPESSPFLPVIRLVSRVVGVRRLPPGHPVGYGLSWRATEEHEHVAVVAVGYNDGYPRHLSNSGWMSIHGRRCPVVGNVCMDVTMVDISAVDDDVQPGDEVVVYGTNEGEPPLVEMARRAGTIPYELLTRLSPRVRRIYQRER